MIGGAIGPFCAIQTPAQARSASCYNARMTKPANIAPPTEQQRATHAAVPFAIVRADQSEQALHLGEPGYLCVRKTASCLRELETSDAMLSFEIVGALGSGAYRDHHATSSEHTAVYLARCANYDHPDLRSCIVKTTRDETLAANEWFHLTSYRSPAFPTPFLFGTVVAPDDASGATFALVAEHIEGPTLQQLISRGFGRDCGPAPVEKALEIMSPLAGSFKELSLAMHPFVHRDIKPDNIVVCQDDHGQQDRHSTRTRLIDLGTSSHRHDGEQSRTLGATRGFAPPELLGETPSDVHAPQLLDDPRIDTYSLAATIFALVTGTLAQTGDQVLDPNVLRHDAAMVRQIADDAEQNLYRKHRARVPRDLLDRLVAQALEDFDRGFADLVTRALSADQTQRPTPAEFFDALPRKYVASLVDDVQILYLRHVVSGIDPDDSGLRTVDLSQTETVRVNGTPLSNDYRYDGFLEDFHAAMAAYNNGDYDRAVPLLQKLDAAGDATSSYNLGVCYKDGLGGLQRDDVRKLACWTKAAQADHVVAMYNVGVCHEQGIGIAPSPQAQEAARMWYARAAEGGFPAAIERMRRYRRNG